MRGVVLPLLLAGCAGPRAYTGWQTPPEVPVLPDTIAPTEVVYELLGVATGKACGEVPRSAKARKSRAALAEGLELGMGDPLLYQAARYEAIASVAGADNLTAVRVRATGDGREQCVEVTGRAYRIQDMRTVVAPRADGPAWVSLDVASPGLGAVPGARPAERPRRKPGGVGVVATVGVPTYGLPLLVGVTGTRGWFGWDVAGELTTGAVSVGPRGGVSLGPPVGEHLRPFGALRLGYTLGYVWSPWVAVHGGLDATWGAFGVRAETGVRAWFDGPVGFDLEVGPQLRF